MMFTEYLKFTSEEQWEILWEKGLFLINFKSIDCSYSLYAINNFFVEVELDILTGKLI